MFLPTMRYFELCDVEKTSCNSTGDALGLPPLPTKHDLAKDTFGTRVSLCFTILNHRIMRRNETKPPFLFMHSGRVTLLHRKWLPLMQTF